MNTKNFSRVACIVVFLIFQIFHSGASALVRAEALTEKEILAQGGKQLTASEIEKNFAGKIVVTRILTGDHSGRLREHIFNSDGTFRSRNLWDKGEDGYQWFVSGDQLLCRRYAGWYGASRSLKKSSLICRKVYILAQEYYWVSRGGTVECVVVSIK